MLDLGVYIVSESPGLIMFIDAIKSIDFVRITAQIVQSQDERLRCRSSWRVALDKLYAFKVENVLCEVE